MDSSATTPKTLVTPGVFVTTHWTQVLAAQGKSPEAKQALSDLCSAYYGPVVTFIRYSGHAGDAARDLAHEFFAGLLAHAGFEGADPQRGRFRSYLLGAVKHFLSNHRARVLRDKRGAGAVHEPIAPATDTSPGLEVPDPAALPDDAVFDRDWALQILECALETLAEECEAAGTIAIFHALKPWLTGDRVAATQAEVARELGLSVGAVRVAIYRLRKRFRVLVRAELAQTVSQVSEVEEELRHLIAALSRG
jgi:RNA polymerase sigma factor (sigma-70 family)